MKLRVLLILALVALVNLPSVAFADEVGVLVRFGLTDTTSSKWDGSVSVSSGKVENVGGWRFQMKDGVEGTTWTAMTRPLTVRRSNNGKKGAQQNKKKAPASRWPTTASFSISWM